MRTDPVSMGMRVVEANPGHVTVVVWIGRNEGARGNSGQLVIRYDEWWELVADTARGFDILGTPGVPDLHPVTGQSYAAEGRTCRDCRYAESRYDGERTRLVCMQSLDRPMRDTFRACAWIDRPDPRLQP